MPATLYNPPGLAHGLYPLNDFSAVSAPLSPSSEDTSSSLPPSAWGKPDPRNYLSMSSPLQPGQSPRQELNPQDPYLSAPSDQEELDFQASVIRITPAPASPNHSSSPNDGMESRRPSIQSLGYLAPQANSYVDPISAGVSPSPSNYLAPSDIDLASGAGWQQGNAPFGPAAPVTTAQQPWSSSMEMNPSQWVGLEHPDRSTEDLPQAASARWHSLSSSQQPGLGISNPGCKPPQLHISSENVPRNQLTPPSASRGRSPIVLTVEEVRRGDSPKRDYPGVRRLSRSSHHLSAPGDLDGELDEFELDVADEDERRPISSVSVARTHDGNWIRDSVAGPTGLGPLSRGNEHVPSPNDLKGQRERDMRNQDIGLWSADVSEANSEAGYEAPTSSRRRKQMGHRLRARSTGDRPLQREDYFNLQFNADNPVPGPGVMLHEDEDSDDNLSGNSDGTTSNSLPDSPIADANEPGRYDRSTPDIYPSLETNQSDANCRLYPWQDPPGDPTRRMEALQPGSSTAAMVAFEKRAKDVETASLTATIDNNSIINFGATFDRLKISDPEQSKKQAKRSNSLFKRHFSMLKRQSSDLSVSTSNPSVQLNGTETPQRKDSGSHRNRLSFSNKSNRHVRSPSLTNALISMSGQMAAVGGNNAVHAVSPNIESTPNTLKRGRSRSELPRAPSPGLMDLMTSHGGPPVAGIYHSPGRGTSMEQVPASSVPEPHTAGADDDDDIDGNDDKGLVMEFPPISRLPVPTFKGFKAQIEQVNPRLQPALVHRFALEQVRRYKKLVELQQKHSVAVASRNCKAGKFCFALGGEAVMLEQRKTLASSEIGQAQFRVTDLNSGPDQSYVLGEEAIAPAQFPPGVPVPPATHLPAEFECSICFAVKKFQKPSDWTKHAHEDAQPFTCSFPECSEPKSFKRKADWVRHENELHRHLEWWTCSVAECNHICYRKNNFVQHLVREHKMLDPMSKKAKGAAAEGLTDAQREREVERVWQVIEECRHETSDTPHREPCRFCGNICGNWKKLTVHLGKHMEQLAMPVLELARQSCASPATAHPVGVTGVSQPTQAAPFPRHQDASAHLGHGSYVPSTDANPLPSQNYGYDMSLPAYTSISGGVLSMEPDSMTDSFEPSEQYSGYGMGQFDPATLHPPGQAHHPLHQTSVTYPPPYNAGPRPRTPDANNTNANASANAPMLPSSYSMSSHLHPQASTLYPTEVGYPAYQPVVTTSPYTSGPYTSSYSSQI